MSLCNRLLYVFLCLLLLNQLLGITGQEDTAPPPAPDLESPSDFIETGKFIVDEEPQQVADHRRTPNQGVVMPTQDKKKFIQTKQLNREPIWAMKQQNIITSVCLRNPNPSCRNFFSKGEKEKTGDDSSQKHKLDASHDEAKGGGAQHSDSEIHDSGNVEEGSQTQQPVDGNAQRLRQAQGYGSRDNGRRLHSASSKAGTKTKSDAEIHGISKDVHDSDEKVKGESETRAELRDEPYDTTLLPRTQSVESTIAGAMRKKRTLGRRLNIVDEIVGRFITRTRGNFTGVPVEVDMEVTKPPPPSRTPTPGEYMIGVPSSPKSDISEVEKVMRHILTPSPQPESAQRDYEQVIILPNLKYSTIGHAAYGLASASLLYPADCNNTHPCFSTSIIIDCQGSGCNFGHNVSIIERPESAIGAQKVTLVSLFIAIGVAVIISGLVFLIATKMAMDKATANADAIGYRRLST